MSDEQERNDKMEATYIASLSALDELPFGDQCMVLINWVKYVMMRHADARTPATKTNLLPAFAIYCSDFAINVMELPDLVPARALDRTQRTVCPDCANPACVQSDASAVLKKTIN